MGNEGSAEGKICEPPKHVSPLEYFCDSAKCKNRICNNCVGSQNPDTKEKFCDICTAAQQNHKSMLTSQAHQTADGAPMGGFEKVAHIERDKETG